MPDFTLALNESNKLNVHKCDVSPDPWKDFQNLPCADSLLMIEDKVQLS